MASGENYISVYECCASCQGLIERYLKSKPKENEPAIFKFKMFNTDKAKHIGTENRRLNWASAQVLYQSVDTPSSIKYRIANESVELFQHSVENVSSRAIACGRYRQRKNNKLAENPIFALELLNNIVNFVT